MPQQVNQPVAGHTLSFAYVERGKHDNAFDRYPHFGSGDN
jgi:hypothetical protein